jgi:hypothetical protein
MLEVSDYLRGRYGIYRDLYWSIMYVLPELIRALLECSHIVELGNNYLLVCDLRLLMLI